MSTNSHLYLPPELWLRVLRQHTDPEHLWTQCRKVSSAWRGEIHRIFRDRYLQDPAMTEIRVRLGRFRPLRLYFARLDPQDESRCIFSQTDKEVAEDEDVSPITRLNKITEKIAKDHLFQQKLNSYLRGSPGRTSLAEYFGYGRGSGRIELGGLGFPAHTVRVKGTINDTELPGLRVNYDDRGLSFQWLPMFDSLFREQDTIERTMLAMLSLDQNTPMNPPNKPSEVLAETREWHELLDTVRTQVRRQRIGLWYKSQQINHHVFDEFSSLVHERHCLDSIDEVILEVLQMEFSEDAEQTRLRLAEEPENDMKEENMEEKVDDASAQDWFDHWGQHIRMQRERRLLREESPRDRE